MKKLRRLRRLRYYAFALPPLFDFGKRIYDSFGGPEILTAIQNGNISAFANAETMLGAVGLLVVGWIFLKFI